MEKMIDETSFWSGLTNFLVLDDRSRWRLIVTLILIVGTAGSIDLALLNSPLDDAVELMTALTLILFIIFLARRSITKFPRQISHRPLAARALIAQVIFVALVALALLKVRQGEAKTVEQVLQRTSQTAFEAESAQKAERALAAARVNRIKIDSRLFLHAGSIFMRASYENPPAWSTVREFLGYRSFLNADLYPRMTHATGHSNYRTTLTITSVGTEQNRPAFEVVFAGGYASGERSARLESLSNPQPQGSEFNYFIVNGGNATIGLDGEYMKNVIIRNSDISYAGGPVRLENVWFVNCTFHDYSSAGKATKLGETILASGSVTFTTAS